MLKEGWKGRLIVDLWLPSAPLSTQFGRCEFMITVLVAACRSGDVGVGGGGDGCW